MVLKTLHFPELYRRQPGATDDYYESRLALIYRMWVNCDVVIDQEAVLGQELIAALRDWPPQYENQVRTLLPALLDKNIFHRTNITAAHHDAPGHGCDAALTVANSYHDQLDGIAPRKPCRCGGKCDTPQDWYTCLMIDPEAHTYRDRFEALRTSHQQIPIPPDFPAEQFIAIYLTRFMEGSNTINIHDRNLGRILFDAVNNLPAKEVEDYVKAQETLGIDPEYPKWGDIKNFDRTIHWLCASLKEDRFRHGKQITFTITTEIGLITMNRGRPNVGPMKLKAAMYLLEAYNKYLQARYAHQGVHVVIDPRLGFSERESLDHERYLLTRWHAIRYDRGIDMMYTYDYQERMRKTNLEILLLREVIGDEIAIPGEFAEDVLAKNRDVLPATRENIDLLCQRGKFHLDLKYGRHPD